MKKLSAVLAVSVLLVAGQSAAHVVWFEPQAKAIEPWLAPAADDFSADQPCVLDNITGSKAIYGFLDVGDVDFFQFTLDPPDAGAPDASAPVSAMLAALALSPACEQTVDNYVSVALIGPGLPLADAGVTLPFAVPAGMGVLVKINPVVPVGQGRPVFYEPTSRTSSYLPLGATNDCIWKTPWSCDWSNSLAPILQTAGTYTIAVWAENNVRQDYSVSVGFKDTGYYYKSADEPLTYDNASLHYPCTVVGLDAGAGASDGSAEAAAPADAGADGSPADASVGPPVDASATDPGAAAATSSGCDCSVGSRGVRGPGIFLIAGLLALWFRRPGTRRRANGSRPAIGR
jgi:MYXO-CTERM domain-containing protein